MEILTDIENNDDYPKKPEPIERKLTKFWIVLLLANIAFVAVIIRLFVVQVSDAERFRIRAEHQQQSKIELKAERGNIYDRNGKIIASTIHSISVAVDPRLLKEKIKVCKALEQATGIPYKAFLRKINSAKGSFVWLARGIMPGNARALEHIDAKGLLKFREPKRNFLYGSVGAQVIGTANIDNIGISGIEKQYDTLLTGKSGFMIMLRDAIGNLHASADLPVIPAVNGKSIMLTIDIDLQRIAEFELKKGVEESMAASGTVVVMKPSTGEILAMASYPTFDPNNLTKDAQEAMKSKALTDTYEPGSTFKCITAASALDDGDITPQTMVNGLGGTLSFAQYTIKDDHPVGRVTFRVAFEKSSNVVFAQVGYNIPSKKFYKYVRDFGFGNTLGIEIAGEVNGWMPNSNGFNPVTKRYLSHGYGISVTALQMVNAYSTIANKGIMMKPHLVKAFMDSQGEVKEYVQPQKIRRVISKRTCDTLADMLCGVVERGTGKRARIQGMKIGGKTGTSQQLVNGSYENHHYTGSFIGFLPAYDPEIAMIVVIDKPRGAYYGGATAAPVFQSIAMRWIAVNTEFNYGKSVKSNDTVIVPSVEGYFSVDAMRILTEFGLKPKLENLDDGIITIQKPQQGASVPKGTEIALTAQKFKILISNTLDKKTKESNYRPDVRGLSLRKAIAILHQAGIHAKVVGSGKVVYQQWEYDNEHQLMCTLNCQ